MLRKLHQHLLEMVVKCAHQRLPINQSCQQHIFFSKLLLSAEHGSDRGRWLCGPHPSCQDLKKLQTQSQGIMSLCTWAHRNKIRLLVRGHEPFPNPDRTVGVAVYAFRGNTGMMKWRREQVKTRAGIQLLSKRVRTQLYSHTWGVWRWGWGCIRVESSLSEDRCSGMIISSLALHHVCVVGGGVRPYGFIRAQSGLGSPYTATLSLNSNRQWIIHQSVAQYNFP